MFTLSPTNRSENQNKTIDEKIRSLQNQILAEAKSLHTLQMDKKFNHIIPFFTSNCDNVNLESLVQSYDLNPTVMLTIISHRFENFVLSFQNNCEQCLEKLHFNDNSKAKVNADSTEFDSNIHKQPNNASQNKQGNKLTVKTKAVSKIMIMLKAMYRQLVFQNSAK